MYCYTMYVVLRNLVTILKYLSNYVNNEHVCCNKDKCCDLENKCYKKVM